MNIGDLFVRLRADTSDFENGMKKAEKTATNTTGSMKSQAMKLAQQYKKEGMNMSDAMTKAWSEIERTSVNGSNNSSSNLSAFKAIIASNLNQIGQQMAQTGKQILSSLSSIITTASEWSAEVEQQKFVYNNLDPAVQKAITSNMNLANSLGMTKQQYLNNSTAISDFLQRMGMTGNEIAGQSEKITQLTADMAAFANVPVDTAVRDFKSALVGNFEAVDKYGLSISVATINSGEYAKTLGKTWLKMNDAEKSQAILSTALSQSSSYTKLAQQEASGFTMQMQQMKQRIMEASAAIGEKLFPVLEPVISKIIDWTKSVTDWVSENPKLTQGILLVVGAIGGLLAIGGPILMVFASLASISLAVGIGMLPLTGIIAGITLAIVALVAGGIALWQNWDTVKAKAIEIWNSICDSVSEAYNKIKEWLLNMVDSVVQWATDLYNNAVKAGQDFVNGISIFFTELPGKVSEWLSETINNISAWCSDTYNTFITWCSDTINGIVQWFSDLPYKIGFALGYVLGTITKWGVDTWNYLVENVPKWIDAVVTFFSELPGKIQTWLTNTINNIISWGTNVYNKSVEIGTNFVNNIVTFFSQLPGKVSTWITNAYNNIVNWGTNVKNKAIEVGAQFINNIINFFTQLPGKIQTWLTNTIAKVTTFATQMGTKATNAAKDFSDKLVNGVKSIPSKMATAGKNIVEGLWKGITGAGNWLKDKITGFANGIMDGFKKAFQIHSPSRLMRDEIGKFLPEGIAVGIDANADSVYDSLTDLASKSKVVGANAFDNVINGYSANISSNIKTGFKEASNGSNNSNSLVLNIENFNNNTDKDIEYLANELAFYLKRKNIALGGV